MQQKTTLNIILDYYSDNSLFLCGKGGRRVRQEIWKSAEISTKEPASEMIPTKDYTQGFRRGVNSCVCLNQENRQFHLVCCADTAYNSSVFSLVLKKPNHLPLRNFESFNNENFFFFKNKNTFS